MSNTCCESIRVRVEMIIDIPSDQLVFLDDNNIEKKVTSTQIEEWIRSELLDQVSDLSDNPFEFRTLVADDVKITMEEIENGCSKCYTENSSED